MVPSMWGSVSHCPFYLQWHYPWPVPWAAALPENERLTFCTRSTSAKIHMHPNNQAAVARSCNAYTPSQPGVLWFLSRFPSTPSRFVASPHISLLRNIKIPSSILCTDRDGRQKLDKSNRFCIKFVRSAFMEFGL